MKTKEKKEKVNGELLTSDEVIELLDISKTTLYRMVKRGGETAIPFTRPTPRLLRFEKDKVLAWAIKRGSRGRLRDGHVNQFI